MPSDSQADLATKRNLSPVESAIHARAVGLENEISKLEPSATPALDKLRKAATDIGKSREDKYRLYENGLRTLKEGIEKNDPWALFNAANTIRRPSERGTLGLSRRNLTPDEIKEGYRVYAHMILGRYEKMTDAMQMKMRDRINDGVLQKAVLESGDQNVKDGSWI